MGEMGEIQPEICLPSTRIWCREPMWIGISASGHGSTTASTHLWGTGRERRRGERVHARRGHGSIHGSIHGFIHGSIHGSIHGIHARVLMHDEQPRARLVTRVGRGDDRERRRVDGQLRVRTCAERGRRGEHVHACGAPQGSTVGTEPERERRGEHLRACWAGTVSAHLPTLIASLIMQSSCNHQAINRQSSGNHHSIMQSAAISYVPSRRTTT
jgi:hypothetical protein